MTDIPDELLCLLDMGWHIFPVSRQTKKTPYKGAMYDATTSLSKIREWMKKYPDCNWRVHPGKSNIFCLDIDRSGSLHDNDGFETMRNLTRTNGRLPYGPRLITGGSRGCVVFFRYEGQELRGGPNALGKGIDVSTIRGAVCPTVPPSIHQVSGGKYIWHKRRSPWIVPLPPIPQWIIKELTPPPIPDVDLSQVDAGTAEAMLNTYLDRVQKAPSGASNRTLYNQSFRAGKLVKGGFIDYNSAHAMLRSAAQVRIKGEDVGSIIPTIHSGLRSGMRST